MSESDRGNVDKPSLKLRGPEVGVAALLAAIALLVIADSLRVGIGWADDGPRSGYFPFYIGLFLLAASLAVMIPILLQWRETTAVFAEHAQLRTVFAMLLPMVVYVGGIAGLGIYVSSFLLISYFMRQHGTYRWPSTLAVAAGVPVAFFLVFERWFLVPLPKGPIEQWLGL